MPRLHRFPDSAAPLLVLFAGLTLAACPKSKPPPADGPPDAGDASTEPAEPSCADTIEDRFGPQQNILLVLSPKDGGHVFRPDILAELIAVTELLDDEAWGGGRRIRSPVTAPLGEPRSGAGVRITSFADEPDADPERIKALEQLLRSIEMAANDSVSPDGTLAWIHVPREAFDDELPAVLERLATLAPSLHMAADLPDRRARYMQVSRLDPAPSDGAGGEAAVPAADPAGRGNPPGSPHIDVVLTLSEDRSFKEPGILRGLEQLQTELESMPETAQTFSIADDVKMARRNTKDGAPETAVIPERRGEVNNLLNLFEMSGNADLYGRRMTRDGRSALLRINIAPMSEPERLELAGRIRTSSEGAAGGLWTVTVCVDSGAPVALTQSGQAPIE